MSKNRMLKRARNLARATRRHPLSWEELCAKIDGLDKAYVPLQNEVREAYYGWDED